MKPNYLTIVKFLHCAFCNRYFKTKFLKNHLEQSRHIKCYIKYIDNKIENRLDYKECDNAHYKMYRKAKIFADYCQYADYISLAFVAYDNED